MKRQSYSVSSSAEEYLLTLYRYEYEGKRAGTSELAKLFGVKAPSVTGMLRRLYNRGWVHYRRYRPAELTPAGRALAVRLIRRHRLLETFLVKYLDYSPEEVHDEVQILEHTVSDTLLNKIDEKLGHPSFDPHGDPIPDESEYQLNVSRISSVRYGSNNNTTFPRIDSRKRYGTLGKV